MALARRILYGIALPDTAPFISVGDLNSEYVLSTWMNSYGYHWVLFGSNEES